MAGSRSSPWLRWLRHAIVVAVLLGVSAVLFRVLDSPSAADFCTGRRKCKLTRLTLSGQGCRGTLSDQVSLEWFASRPRFGALPPDTHFNDGVTFEAQLFDRLGRYGTVYVSIPSNKQVLQLTYFTSLLDDCSFSYLLLGSNLPPQLDSLFSFLLAPESRGKSWNDGTVQLLEDSRSNH